MLLTGNLDGFGQQVYIIDDDYLCLSRQAVRIRPSIGHWEMPQSEREYL